MGSLWVQYLFSGYNDIEFAARLFFVDNSNLLKREQKIPVIQKIYNANHEEK